MDNKYTILAEEIHLEQSWVMASNLTTDREKQASIRTLKILATKLATRFILCDLAFDANEFMTKCGFKDY